MNEILKFISDLVANETVNNIFLRISNVFHNDKVAEFLNYWNSFAKDHLMLVCFLFLLTCILSARYLEKKRMTLAAAFYSVLFIFMTFFFLISVNIPYVHTALRYLLGEEIYDILHKFALEAINASIYGIGVLWAVGVIFIIQSVSVVIITAHSVAKRLFKFKKVVRAEFRKLRPHAEYKIPSLQQRVPLRIHLLYCRLLN